MLVLQPRRESFCAQRPNETKSHSGTYSVSRTERTAWVNGGRESPRRILRSLVRVLAQPPLPIADAIVKDVVWESRR